MRRHAGLHRVVRTSHASLARWFVLFLASLALVACTTPATQVIVQLDTDLPESRTVVVRVTASQFDTDGGAFGRPTNWTFTRGGPLGEHQLPGTFGVNPASDAARNARVQLVVSVFVAAESASEPSLFFRRTVRFQFAPHRTLNLGVFLSLHCAEPAVGCTSVSGSDCTVSTLCEERGLTCGDRAECVAGDVMPRDPDAGFTDDLGPLDATLDTGPGEASAGHVCATSDSECAPDEHCDMASHVCVAGCHDDSGCTLASARHCDATMHTCVACTSDSHCPSDTRCAGGSCAPGCSDATQCAPGRGCCGGVCLDTLTSNTACGACGMTCAPPNAAPACVGGACTIRECVAPFLDCNGDLSDGCEANGLTSPDHCGACNRPCMAGPNATASCVSGACVRACAAGFADCNGDPSDGCEVTLATDAAHCGTCGRACTVANGTGACVAGNCTVTACSPGWGDCNGSFGDGCEDDVLSDRFNCGTCGTLCSVPSGGSAPACAAGVCTWQCGNNRGDCDGNAANGCEEDLWASASNCGRCGNACSFANASANCEGGGCAIRACNTGWGDCDGTNTNGCETDLQNTATSCGVCNYVCTPVPNATRSCRSAVCVTNCAPRYGDCDFNVGNGCESGPVDSFPVMGCTNIAASATVTASPQYGPPYDVRLATDGNICSRALLGNLAGQFLFDWGTTRSMRGVTITPVSTGEASAGVSIRYDLYTSTDGSTFAFQTSVTLAPNDTHYFDFGGNQNYRVLRFDVSVLGGGYPGFGEVVVHQCP